MIPTIIWRHKKENLKKCSLRNLETRPDLLFLTYPKQSLPNINNYIFLTLDAPPLTNKDSDKGLFFIDATWKYADIMAKKIPCDIKLEKRSIPPNFQTAYPRRQTLCPDPSAGLATVEALYLTYLITGKNPQGLLDHYYFKDDFLKKNKLLLSSLFPRFTL